MFEGGPGKDWEQVEWGAWAGALWWGQHHGNRSSKANSTPPMREGQRLSWAVALQRQHYSQPYHFTVSFEAVWSQLALLHRCSFSCGLLSGSYGGASQQAIFGV